jgi:hypothetical protein
MDGEDGHRRVTRAEDFVLLGGSQETHERMQDVAIQVNEALKDKGKRMQEAEPRELLELVQRALERG